MCEKVCWEHSPVAPLAPLNMAEAGLWRHMVWGQKFVLQKSQRTEKSTYAPNILSPITSIYNMKLIMILFHHLLIVNELIQPKYLKYIWQMLNSLLIPFLLTFVKIFYPEILCTWALNLNLNLNLKDPEKTCFLS